MIMHNNIMMTTSDSFKPKPHSQESIPSFIRKTYDILEEAKFPDIIDWNADGTALVIKKATEFCQKVLPTYFKHNNLTSFVRQLNMYNFHKRRTQNLDQVYSHELFQRGKRHLLKEIKRKTHDQTADKTPKSNEVFDFSQQGKDISSLSYENQILKRLYNDALAKLNVLEGDIKDLNAQNQSLWNQLYHNRDPNYPQEKSSLTQDQLPMTLGGEIYIPPLRLRTEEKPQYDLPFVKNNSIGCFFNLETEGSCESTEDTSSTFGTQTFMEGERCLELTESSSSTYNQDFSNEVGQFSSPFAFPQATQSNELFPSRQEVSIGQLLASWGNDTQPNERFEEESKMTSLKGSDDLLGKRSFESAKLDTQLDVFEPLSKHVELSLGVRKGLISTGLGSEAFDLGMDFVDFNNGGYAWTN